MADRTDTNNHRLDEIDRQIIYSLMVDARNTSAPTIAEEVNVAPATVRSRINQLEENGVIRGYSASIDFERANGRLKNLYICNVPVAEREALAQEARTIPNVLRVTELMTGRRNLHVIAVGEDTEDIRAAARRLDSLGIEIEDENLVQNEATSPYLPFGPDEESRRRVATDVISLTGNANVIEVTVRENAAVAGLSIQEIAAREILDEESLVIAIERDERVITPHGDTTLQPDDIVTLLIRSGDDENALAAFGGEQSGVEQ